MENYQKKLRTCMRHRRYSSGSVQRRCKKQENLGDGWNSNIYFTSALQCKPLYTGLYGGQSMLLAKLVESWCI